VSLQVRLIIYAFAELELQHQPVTMPEVSVQAGKPLPSAMLSKSAPSMASESSGIPNTMALD